METKKAECFEPWFFLFFGVFHLHRIWGLMDRNAYAGFWLRVMEEKGGFYYLLMGSLGVLCLLGIVTFFRNLHCNFWWRWIYLFGGGYLLFDLFAIAAGLTFWQEVLRWMFDVSNPCWNAVWLAFIFLGGAVFMLGVKLLLERRK